MTSVRCLCLLLALTACGELADPERPGNKDPATHASNIDSPEDGGDGQGPTLPPSPPVVDAPAAVVGFDSVPISGTTAAFGTIFIEGGKSPVASEADDQGRFCIDVPLKERVTHRLEIFAQDDAGEISAATSVTVRQDPAARPAPEPLTPPLEERAQGHDVVANESPTAGMLSSLTDGDTSSMVTVPESTVWIDLGATFTVEGVDVIFADSLGMGSDTFATEYEVLFAADADPVLPPGDAVLGWSSVAAVPGIAGLGDGGIDRIEVTPAAQARWVAVHVVENNKTDWMSWGEEIRISELRVFGRAIDTTTAPVVAPSCSNP